MAVDESDDKPDPHDFTDPSPSPPADIDLAILCDALQERGVTRVLVRYAGSGDSGSVEEVVFFPANVTVPEWLEDQLSGVAENYCPEGYENNDGGSGTLTVYPFEGLALLEHYDRYEDSQAIDTETTLLPAELQAQLAHLGVTGVEAHVDGYGDSGQLEEFMVQPESIQLDEQLAHELEEFLLNLLPGGWEDNEGCYGDFTVDVRTRAVAVVAFWRVENDSDAQMTHWNWRQSWLTPTITP